MFDWIQICSGSTKTVAILLSELITANAFLDGIVKIFVMAMTLLYACLHEKFVYNDNQLMN